MENTSTSKGHATNVIIEESPISRFLFGDVRLSWLWLIIRLYTGYIWLSAGWEKITSPVWIGAKGGVALTGFIANALKLSSGTNPSVQSWYAAFLQNIVLPHVSIWSVVVAVGEFLVGVALILGLFTGVAAFFAGFMNFSYLMAGTVSVNPFLFVFATWLVLAWKTAGWLGLDHWVLPALGTPWRPGNLIKNPSKKQLN